MIRGIAGGHIEIKGLLHHAGPSKRAANINSPPESCSWTRAVMDSYHKYIHILNPISPEDIEVLIHKRVIRLPSKDIGGVPAIGDPNVLKRENVFLRKP